MSVREELKSRVWSSYQQSIRSNANNFTNAIAARIILKEALADRKDGAVASVVVTNECTVEDDMLNGSGNTHGACLAYLMDLCTTFALQLHSLEVGGSGIGGTTQALNIVYHAPAVLGSTLRIISTSLIVDDKSMSGKCEIWDTNNKRLVASGLQVKSTTARARL